MNNVSTFPLQFTDTAVRKVKALMTEKKNLELKFRVYITGGGCSGFKYGFTLDKQITEDDVVFETEGVVLVVDSLSLQYLVGGLIDYTESLEGSRFIISNPNAKTTCGCGFSFEI